MSHGSTTNDDYVCHGTTQGQSLAQGGEGQFEIDPPERYTVLPAMEGALVLSWRAEAFSPDPC